MTHRYPRVQLNVEPVAKRGSVFTGAVLSDVNGHPVADAEIHIADLKRTTFTNAAGAFRISDVAAGTYQVQVRRLGYRVVSTSIEFAPGSIVERQILLSRVVTLQPIDVQDAVLDRRLVDFEENRRLGLGRFWTRADLQKWPGNSLAAHLSDVAGARVIRGRGTAAWVVRSRGPMGGSLKNLDSFDIARGAPARGCYASVVVDQKPIYSGRDEEPLFDLSTMDPDVIEAMEYYVGPAQTPARYTGLHSVCGVLVIWTRR